MFILYLSPFGETAERNSCGGRLLIGEFVGVVVCSYTPCVELLLGQAALHCASARLRLHVCQLRLGSRPCASNSKHLWQRNFKELVKSAPWLEISC